MTKPIPESEQRYCVQSEKHYIHTNYGLCSLLQHQSLVDIAICGGNNVLHAHKAILAANSSYFRKEFELNQNIEQIILSGLEFSVIRSLVEFMYCGETYISGDNIKYLCALGKMLHMKVLETLCNEVAYSDGSMVLPKPQFLTKKSVYPAYPFNIPNPLPPCTTPLKPLNLDNNLYKPQKKRKGRDEPEHQACLKEAQASRKAIANLKKEISFAPQSSTFIIEDACSETTVENFIPSTSAPAFIEVDVNGQVILPENKPFDPEMPKSNIVQLSLPNGETNLTADKIKKILGNQANSNVEIMFRTNDGSFVNVTDDVLQNLQKDGLQYQVIDEEGRVGEIQELELSNKEQAGKNPEGNNIQFFAAPKMPEMPSVTDLQNSIILPLMNDNEMADLKPIPNFEVSQFFQNPKTEINPITITESMLLENTKFSPDMFFAETIEKKSILP